MPYKDPQKRREQNRIAANKYKKTSKARQARRKYVSDPTTRKHINEQARAHWNRQLKADMNSVVYIVYSPSDPTWIKVGETGSPVLRMRHMKVQNKTGATVQKDAVYYYKHEVDKEHRYSVEQLFITELKKRYKPKSTQHKNESFYISGADDLEKIRDILVECAMFQERSS